jgi:hypothetical protein
MHPEVGLLHGLDLELDVQALAVAPDGFDKPQENRYMGRSRFFSAAVR